MALRYRGSNGRFISKRSASHRKVAATERFTSGEDRKTIAVITKYFRDEDDFIPASVDQIVSVEETPLDDFEFTFDLEVVDEKYFE